MTKTTFSFQHRFEQQISEAETRFNKKSQLSISIDMTDSLSLRLITH
jgi:hypothetical protein